MNEAGNPISNLKVVFAPVDARAKFNDRSSEVDAYDGPNRGEVFDCLPYRSKISKRFREKSSRIAAHNRSGSEQK